MKRVGVTGAAGFIGSHLCKRLLAERIEVVGVDDLSRGSLRNLETCLDNPRFSFDVLDCTRRHELRGVFTGCDAIVHLAAQKIPRYGGALMTLEANVAGVNAACSAALALDADLILASTSDVYGNGPSPLREDGPLVIGPPTTRRWAYAASKLYDEHVALALAATTYAAFYAYSWNAQMAVYVVPLAAVFLCRVHLVELARVPNARLLGVLWLVLLTAAGAGLTLRDAQAESAAVHGPGGSLKTKPAQAAWTPATFASSVISAPP